MTTGAMPIRQAFCGRMSSLPSVIPAMIDPGGEHPLAGSVHDEFDFASLRVIAFHFDPAIVALDFLDPDNTGPADSARFLAKRSGDDK